MINQSPKKFVYIICVCTKNAHTYSIYFENINIYIYIYNIYIYIYLHKYIQYTHIYYENKNIYFVAINRLTALIKTVSSYFKL